VEGEGGRAGYFREVSRAFLERRGAPFFLSPRDLALVAAWERAGLPLAVVLEGIEKAFEPRRGRSGPRGKVLALAFCRPAVERAFELHRERAVGGRRRAEASRPENKRSAALAALDAFLAASQASPAGLGEILSEAREELRTGSPDADALIRLDERVDSILASRVPEGERAAARELVRREHARLRGASLEAAVRTLLAKEARARAGVPYVSLFYY
jgi:hypothetical protein